MINKNIEIFSYDWKDYELLDSGNRKKLERFGNKILVREEPKAWWRPELPKSEWSKAEAIIPKEKGDWQLRRRTGREWTVDMAGITCFAKLTDGNKHVGIFPEQCAHWNWTLENPPKGKGKKLLNLFGYTGIASVIAAKAGYNVTHVDASKPAIAWGRKNLELSNMSDLPIRWILDDAMKFVKREIRRGNKYDAIILDPPSYGRGPNREIWKVEEMITELLDSLKQILVPEPEMVLLNMYSIDASPLMVANVLKETMYDFGGQIQPGELVLQTTNSERTLPMSIYARWTSN